jgi:phenylacetate-coenzyme A ligase PaaK-like adenylate-forming protein
MIDDLINKDVFKTKSHLKKIFFLKKIKSLTLHHYNNCINYKKIIQNINFKINKKNQLENFPMIPVRLFKKFDLKSVPDKKVVKKIVSSGTSNQSLSKIYLDKQNASNQVKVLGKIMEKVLGKKRLPMLIIDQDPSLLNKIIFNARVAAIYGFSIFGKNYCYLLDRNNKINYKLLNQFLKKYGKDNFFIFGFTSLVYENLIKKLSVKKLNLKFNNGILIHGGGWKKLENLKISSHLFKKKLREKINLKKIHNYYGLVEQTGSIFIEPEKCSYLHTSIYSDIFIRDKNFKVLANKKKGLIQLLSLLPTSYPGHNILTEDIGEIIGNDDCKCGLTGKYFLVHGRAKQAEMRGCSDVR